MSCWCTRHSHIEARGAILAHVRLMSMHAMLDWHTCVTHLAAVNHRVVQLDVARVHEGHLTRVGLCVEQYRHRAHEKHNQSNNSRDRRHRRHRRCARHTRPATQFMQA
jgi:hypothetical protein